ncbi:MAG: 50S ribosomal protein L25 [Candidatus Humimicrobiaceae bacterium]
METLKLTVDKRGKEELKNNASRRLRRANFIPAVLYGLKKDPVSIKVGAKKFKEILRSKGTLNLIFDISIDNSKKTESVILKDMQRDPISRDFLHLDFLRIEMEKEVETSVPIEIINDDIAIGVKEEGGVIQHSLRELHVSCLPRDIPDSISYDIQELKIGDSIRVGDIEVEDNIKVLNDPNEVVVSVIHPSQLIEEEEEVEEVEEEPEIIGREKEEEAPVSEEEAKEPEETPKEE